MPDSETPAGSETGAGTPGGPPDAGPRRDSPRGRRGFRDRPPWWPEGEPWPPRRAGLARWGRSGDWESWRGGGSRRRGHPGGRVGCFVATVVVFIVGIATVATWILVGVLGLVGVAGSTGLPGQVLLALLVGALLLVVLGRGARRVSIPVDDLLEAADRLAQGDYAVRVAEQALTLGAPKTRTARSMTARLSLPPE